MSTINADLLRRVLDEVVYQGWNSSVIAWRSAEDRDGFRHLAYGIEGHVIAEEHPKALWHWLPDPDEQGAEFAVQVAVDGSRKKPGRNASYIARKLLGLDVAQAERLFGATSDDELHRVAGELIALAEGGE